MLRKGEWCAAMWQAHIKKISTVEAQRKALNEVPEAMQKRVKRHLITVRKLKEKRVL